MTEEISTSFKKTNLYNSTLYELDSGKPGPLVTVMAGVHGNESFGLDAISSFFDISLLRGKLCFIRANNAAIEKNVRFIDENLNRLFSDDIVSDSLEGQTATELKPSLAKTDVLLDLHASNSLDSDAFLIVASEQASLVSLFAVSKVLFDVAKFEANGTEDYVFQKGGDAFCLECGSLRDPNTISIASDAISQVLISYGLIEGVAKKYTCEAQFVVRGMYVNKKGRFVPSKRFADFSFISAGSLIGTDGGEPVIAESDCYVVFIRECDTIGSECFLILDKV